MKTPDDVIFTYRSVDPVRRHRFEAGADALKRIDTHKTFHDWHLIGVAVIEMHNECWERSGSLSPAGKGYAAVFRALKAVPRLTPLTELEKGTRSCAKWMAENWDAAPKGTRPKKDGSTPDGVEAWHANLPDDLRRLYNNPVTVKRHYLEDNPPLRVTEDEPKDEDEPTDEETEDEPKDEDEPTDTEDGPEDEDKPEDEPVARPRRSRSADKELWLTSLREIWVQGEDAWRAEFLEEESDKVAHVAGLADVADETERLRTVAVQRAARTARKAKTGGISDENFGVAVLDAADVIASGEVEGPTFPDDLGDKIAASESELQKALHTKLKRPMQRRAVIEENAEP